MRCIESIQAITRESQSRERLNHLLEADTNGNHFDQGRPFPFAGLFSCEKLVINFKN